MKNILRQLEGLATRSYLSDFRKAVIRLTAYYTIGVLLILVVFNIIVYSMFGKSIRTEETERHVQPYVEEEERVELGEERIQEIQGNLADILILSDLLILAVAVVLAYVLSRRTLAPLEEAYKRQARFVADAAHELRTPLAVMQVGSEVILKQERTGGDYVKFIQESLEEVKRLTELSNDLLFLAHAHTKKGAAALQPVSLTELLERHIEAMRLYAETKEVSVVKEIDDNVKVLGKRDDLARLIINLLKNAIDYNKVGGEVRVQLQKKGNQAILSVQDTGNGIEAKALPHIFERFYKADDARVKNASGAGLGLAIVKEIVKEHGGSIEVESVVGKGSLFKVILQTA